jgi:hypothetical protein
MHPRCPAIILAALGCLACLPGCDEMRLIARLAELEAIPDPVVFPDTPVSTVRLQDVTLRNIGTGVVDLKGLEIAENPEDFSLSIPDVLTFPAAIPPGQQVRFAVRYHPQEYPQADQGAVRIRSTDRDAPEYDLRLQGSGVEPILLVRPVPVLFPDTRVMATSPATLTITHTGSDPAPVRLALIAVTDDDDGDFNIQDGPDIPHTLQPGDQVSVRLAYTPGAIDDGDEGVLTLESDADSQERLEIPLLGKSFAPHIEVSSTALNFGTVSQGANPSLPLAISNTGNQELRVTTLELSPTGSQKFLFAPAALPEPIQPGASVQLEVTYLADDRGDDDGVLRILHDDPLERPVFVTLRGRTPEPDIEVVPDYLSIQISGISHTQTADIRIFNLGDEVLRVTGLDFSNPDGSFSIDAQPSFPALIQPGLRPQGPFETLTVRFTKDTATVDDECFITIHSDDGDEPTVVVRVVGSYTP